MERLLTKSEFAELLGVTERTIDRWRAEGVLPRALVVQIGGSVRFYVDRLGDAVRTLQEHHDSPPPDGVAAKRKDENK